MQQELEKPFMEDEVFSPLKNMHPSKAPGLDGFHAMFYQKYWHNIGEAVLKLALGFLNGDESIKGINETYISLIPKIKSLETILEFRPISLCNVVYKIISKTLAIRLKSVLGHLIDKAQSAFVYDMLIIDNVILAFEAFHKIKKGKGSNIAVKVTYFPNHSFLKATLGSQPSYIWRSILRG